MFRDRLINVGKDILGGFDGAPRFSWSLVRAFYFL